MENVEPTIEPFHDGDLDAIMEIENASFTLPWSRKSYEDIMAMDSVEVWVAKHGEELVGYMLTQFVEDEIELHTFAVREDMRRRGIGSRLILHLIARSRQKGINHIYLLVRVANDAARLLYEKFGFRPVGTRTAYYEDNGEDALVMLLTIS
jgi:ribosomal-protein-alanine N-acetyltransferase